jgi:hypothetical protein
VTCASRVSAGSRTESPGECHPEVLNYLLKVTPKPCSQRCGTTYLAYQNSRTSRGKSFSFRFGDSVLSCFDGDFRVAVLTPGVADVFFFRFYRRVGRRV